jgi:hypothetical protein
MKAMFWKEVRENGIWALLGALILVLASVWCVSQRTDNINAWVHLWNESFPVPYTILPPVFGTVLGFLQIMRESRRDQWAFLVHRPVSRSVIFGGKVLAGITLYLGATLIPLLLAGCWFALPGHQPGPFYWGLLLGSFASVLAGIPFYFAAMLTALRPARWYGIHTLGLPLAGAGAFLITVLPAFWQALLTIGLLSLVLGVAAWGSLVWRNSYEGQSKPARFCLGASLFGGGAVVTGAVVAMVQATASSSAFYSYTQNELGPEGQPLQVRINNSDITRVTDLAGKPVPPPAGKPRWDFQDFLDGASVPWTESDNWPGYSYREARRLAVPCDISPTRKEVWFFVPGENLSHVYDTGVNREIGIVGKDGFAPAGKPLPQPFPGHRLTMYGWADGAWMAFSGGVYRVNSETRGADLVLKPPAGKSFIAAGFAPSVRPPYGTDERQALAITGNSLYVSATHRRPAATLPLDAAGANYWTTLYTNGKRYFLWYRNLAADGETSKIIPAALVTLDLRGRVLDRQEFSFPPESRSDTAPATIPLSTLTPVWLLGGFGAFLMVGKVFQLDTALQMLDELAKGPVWLVPFLVYTLLGAALSAVACWQIAARCELPRSGRLQWAIGGFLLGTFGVLMLLGLLEWPSREACAVCGKRRVVTRETCEHCGAEWPEPKPDGTEIFQEVSPVQPDAAVRAKAVN